MLARKCRCRDGWGIAYAVYKGPKLHEDIPERGIYVDHWGNHRKWVANESRGYFDYCEFPLKNATEEIVAAWAMSSPDDYDYSEIAERCVTSGDQRKEAHFFYESVGFVLDERRFIKKYQG